MKRFAAAAGFVLAALMVFSGPLHAADAAAIAARSREAYKEFVAGIRDLRAVTEMRSELEASSGTVVTAYYKKGRKHRIESTGEVVERGVSYPVQEVRVCDGVSSWSADRLPRPKIITRYPGSTKEPPELRSLLGLWFFETPFYSVKDAGSGEVDGRECHILEYTEFPGAAPERIWLDKESFVVLKQEMKTESGPVRSITLTDLRPVGDGGTLYPFRVVTAADGVTQKEVVIREFVINGGISDEAFPQPPDR